MTKKSANRLARDAAKDDLSKMTWDELNATAKDKDELFAAISLQLTTLVRAPFRHYMTKESCNRAGQLLRQLGADLDKLKNELTNLHSKHSHKHGPVDLMDQELWDCLAVFEAYTAWELRIKGIIIPMMNDLAEEFAKGEMTMNNWLASGRPPLPAHQAEIDKQQATSQFPAAAEPALP